ncbi:MAG: DUF2905 domain-containing protein [Syntrophomonadaceae bacterium]|nr:DUF2905 domain-containing protein [Syntrophomonadaceae bacterium]
MQYSGIAKLIIALGLLLLIIGGIMLLASRLGISGFRLPGDIFIQKENFTFFFPITTGIIISIVITIIFNLIRR